MDTCGRRENSNAGTARLVTIEQVITLPPSLQEPKPTDKERKRCSVAKNAVKVGEESMRQIFVRVADAAQVHRAARRRVFVFPIKNTASICTLRPGVSG